MYRNRPQNTLKGRLAYTMVSKNDRHVQKTQKREKGGHPFSLFYIAYVLLCCFEALGVLGNLELVEDILDRSIHEYRKIVHCVVDTVIGHT